MAYRMLDISKWQSTFNAELAKQNGIHTVISRCAYSTSKDSKWDSFSDAIKSSGMNFGCYGFTVSHYKSVSTNLADARTKIFSELESWIELAQNAGVNSWFAIDQELEANQQMVLSKDENTTLLIDA